MSDDLYTKIHNTYKQYKELVKESQQAIARADFLKYAESSSKCGNSSVMFSMATVEMAEYIRNYARSKNFDVSGDGRDVHVSWEKPPRETRK